MQIEMLEITPNAVELIEEAARTCYQSEPGEKTKVGDLVKKLIKVGHHSVIEHAYATFRISGCSRAMTHQLVRHRLMAISQQSQRYVKEDQFDYVIPPAIRKKHKELFDSHMEVIQSMYHEWKIRGIKNEDARFVLPNACCSEIVISANFREFRHIFEIRCDKHAQWEIRYAAMCMLDILNNHAPDVFGDLMYLIDISWLESCWGEMLEHEFGNPTPEFEIEKAE